MKKIILYLAITLFCTATVFAEDSKTRIDARVISADEANRRLLVNFEHPGTGEKKEIMFDVNDGATFKDFKRLSDLEQGDLVTVDYLDQKPNLKAIYIVHMPQTKTYFTHKEIAGALLKINASRDKADVAKS